MTRPAFAIRMRRRTRQDGSPYLAAVLNADVALPAGAEFLLQRIEGGSYVLRVVPPQGPRSPGELEQAAADRLDGSAFRDDPRDRAAMHGANRPFGDAASVAANPAQRCDFRPIETASGHRNPAGCRDRLSSQPQEPRGHR